MEKAKSLLSGSSSNDAPTSAAEKGAPKRHRFNLDKLREQIEPDLAKNIFSLIKSEGHISESYEAAGRERSAFAAQLSDWGDSTHDDNVSEIADSLATIFREVAELEDEFAAQLEESRNTLKAIRNTERNVGPVRNNKSKIHDKLEKARQEKEPDATKISDLEQELSRAEAESLVAEVQLTNITRHKFKLAFDVHMAGMLERAEKQAILAKHARKLLHLVDDIPIKPGDARQPFGETEQARHIISEAEQELKAWTPTHEKIENQEQLIGENALSKEDATDEDIVGAVRAHVQQDQPPSTVATVPPPAKDADQI